MTWRPSKKPMSQHLHHHQSAKTHHHWPSQYLLWISPPCYALETQPFFVLETKKWTQIMLCYCSHCCQEKMTAKILHNGWVWKSILLRGEYAPTAQKDVKISGEKIRCTSRNPMLTFKVSRRKPFYGLSKNKTKMSHKKSFWNTKMSLKMYFFEKHCDMTFWMYPLKLCFHYFF
jgi:hypothetical protein